MSTIERAYRSHLTGRAPFDYVWTRKQHKISGEPLKNFSESIMKVIIFRKAPETIRQLIIGQFPRQWQVMVLGIDEITTELIDADAIIPEGELVDVALLDRAKNLKLVQTGAGYDNVNIEDCTKRKK